MIPRFMQGKTAKDRADLFVTTKLWNDDIRKHRTKDAFQESLDRLGLDYVGLYRAS